MVDVEAVEDLTFDVTDAVAEAAQAEGVTAGTTQEQALEIAVGTEEHWEMKVGRPVVAVLVAVV